MKKILFFIRHGQTDYNMMGIIQGRGVNTELNENGIEQAKQFYLKYKEENFDLILTSTLKRSKQSVKFFIESGIPALAMKELDEMHLGNWEGKEAKGTIRAEWGHIMSEWKKGNDQLPVPGGESPYELSLRQKAFLHIIEKRNEKKILICTHGRALRNMMCLISGLPSKHMDEFPHENFCTYLVESEKGKYRILERNILLSKN